MEGGEIETCWDCISFDNCTVQILNRKMISGANI